MNLKDLVPPLELCQKIPAGEFEDSVFAWCDVNEDFPEYNQYPAVVVRKIAWAATSKKGVFPAPTLQEIMAAMPFCQVYKRVNGRFDARTGDYLATKKSGSNAATAALKLWMELNKKGN